MLNCIKNCTKHTYWRRKVKKLRRKKFRRRMAHERTIKLKKEKDQILKDPAYKISLKEKEALELANLKAEEYDRLENEEAWMRRELLSQIKFREEAKQKKSFEAIKDAQRLKIQLEFLQKLENQKLAIKENKKKHQKLLDKIKRYIKGNGCFPQELLKPSDLNPGKEMCSFFAKTAACIYGDKCARNHSRPGLSRLILIRNFFNHIQMNQSCNTEYGADIHLEFSNTDIYNDFRTFYDDVVQEMEYFGKIINFKVCSNFQPQLRGNVYVEFQYDREALNAYLQLQGRYYARRRLNVEFCSLLSWNKAICGKSILKKCPKESDCNYLHLFKNPGNKYSNSQSIFASQNFQEHKITEKIIENWDNIEGKKERERTNWRWSQSPEKLPMNPSGSTDIFENEFTLK